jgi:hypothetical protein
MDETIGQLPGMSGIRLYRDAVDEAVRRTRRAAAAPRQRQAVPFAALRA